MTSLTNAEIIAMIDRLIESWSVSEANARTKKELIYCKATIQTFVNLKEIILTGK